MNTLDIFRVCTKIRCVVDLVLEELDSEISCRIGTFGSGTLTMPVTLLPMKSAGWFKLSLCIRK